MTDAQIIECVTEAIREAFENPDLHCRYRQTPEQHDEDHLLIRQFAKNLGKINDIKFSILKWLIITVLTLIGGWAGYGVVHKIQGG